MVPVNQLYSTFFQEQIFQPLVKSTLINPKYPGFLISGRAGGLHAFGRILSRELLQISASLIISDWLRCVTGIKNFRSEHPIVFVNWYEVKSVNSYWIGCYVDE